MIEDRYIRSKVVSTSTYICLVKLLYRVILFTVWYIKKRDTFRILDQLKTLSIIKICQMHSSSFFCKCEIEINDCFNVM